VLNSDAKLSQTASVGATVLYTHLRSRDGYETTKESGLSHGVVNMPMTYTCNPREASRRLVFGNFARTCAGVRSLCAACIGGVISELRTECAGFAQLFCKLLIIQVKKLRRSAQVCAQLNFRPTAESCAPGGYTPFRGIPVRSLQSSTNHRRLK
jgi:hypothetical protein